MQPTTVCAEGGALYCGGASAAADVTAAITLGRDKSIFPCDALPTSTKANYINGRFVGRRPASAPSLGIPGRTICNRGRAPPGHLGSPCINQSSCIRTDHHKITSHSITVVNCWVHQATLTKGQIQTCLRMHWPLPGKCRRSHNDRLREAKIFFLNLKPS